MFHVIPISPIPTKLRESFLSGSNTGEHLDVHIVAVTLTEGEIPRLTVIETTMNGMYHDIPFTEIGLNSLNTFHNNLNSDKRLCFTGKPVVTDYLLLIPNKQVCVFTHDKKFLCHGTYHISFEWDSEIWHMISTQGQALIVFQPTHKVLWLSTHESGKCRNNHTELPPWKKQREYYGS